MIDCSLQLLLVHNLLRCDIKFIRALSLAVAIFMSAAFQLKLDNGGLSFKTGDPLVFQDKDIAPVILDMLCKKAAEQILCRKGRIRKS